MCGNGSSVGCVSDVSREGKAAGPVANGFASVASVLPLRVRRAAVATAIAASSAAWLLRESPSLEFDSSSGLTRLGASIPERRIVTLINFVFWPIRHWLVPLDASAMIKGAQGYVGEELEDLGELFDWEAFNRVVDVLNEKQAPIGRYMARIALQRAIATHLRLTQLLKDNPQILEERIDRPLILTGPARSGTTFFHKALSLAAHHGSNETRYLRLWEVSAGAGPFELDPRRPDRRRFAGVILRSARLFCKRLLSLHEWEDLDDPEEETQWIMSSFSGTSWAFWSENLSDRLNDPTRGALRSRILRVFMQVIQWQEGRQYRWVLKSPEHLHALDSILEELPSAKIVLLTRNPAKQMASVMFFAQALVAGVGMHAGVAETRDNALFIACTAQRKLAEETVRLGRRAILVEGGLGVNGTIEAVERVSSFAELPLDMAEATAAVMTEWSKRQQRRSFTYALHEFGLTSEQLAAEAARCSHLASTATP